MPAGAFSSAYSAAFDGGAIPRYYVGPAGGAWNNNANWSGTSGGAPGASFPVAGDSAFLDAGSAGNGPTLTANAACGELDCTGFTGTLDLGGFSLQISGLLFKLVAGMTFTPTGGLIDFRATVGGPVLVTTGGKTLYDVNVQVGAAVIVRQLDSMAVGHNFDHQAGIWEANGFSLSIGGQLRFFATMPAQGFRAGAGTITVSTQLRNDRSDPIREDTSTFVTDGAVTMPLAAAGNIEFFNLTVPATRSLTTSAGSVASTISVFNRLTVGATATITNNAVNANWLVTSGLVDAVLPDPTSNFQFNSGALVWTGTANAAYELRPAVYNAPMSFTSNSAAGVRSWKLMANVAITGNVQFYEQAALGAGATRILDFNGFNLAVTGNLSLGLVANRAFVPNIGASTLSVSGAFYHAGVGIAGPYLWSLAAGQMLIGGNFTLEPTAVQYQPPAYSGAWLISVGGNWSSTGQVIFGLDTGTVRFTSGAGFVIACAFDEIWPVVQFTGGGSTTLPNPFNCYNLEITAGLITAGAVLIVRNLITNAGTLNLGVGTVFVQTGILNTGTINGLGTATIYLQGPLVRLSGFNPTTLIMPKTTVRLQLESAMTIGTFIVEDRVVPGIVVHLAAALYTLGTVNSQVQSGDGCVQMVSSAAGVQYAWNVTGAITSVAHFWPRDCNAGASPVAPVGNLSNKNLGNNAGWTLNTNGQVKLLTDDVGADILASDGIGPIQYCWLVDTSVVNLTARAAAFGAGANNWHRKTNIPLALMDNLNIGATYYIALGLVDDRDRRLAPNIAGGDYVTAVATSGGGGGGGSPGGLHVQTKTVAFA